MPAVHVRTYGPRETCGGEDQTGSAPSVDHVNAVAMERPGQRLRGLHVKRRTARLRAGEDTNNALLRLRGFEPRRHPRRRRSTKVERQPKALLAHFDIPLLRLRGKLEDGEGRAALEKRGDQIGLRPDPLSKSVSDRVVFHSPQARLQQDGPLLVAVSGRPQIGQKLRVPNGFPDALPAARIEAGETKLALESFEPGQLLQETQLVHHIVHAIAYSFNMAFIRVARPKKHGV